MSALLVSVVSGGSYALEGGGGHSEVAAASPGPALKSSIGFFWQFLLWLCAASVYVKIKSAKRN